ncbi:hypothetical protein, partial [Pseudomonas glycinae]|uniref:hypothetical protein n=1 Tax=Pseudomonas glycinae TaxID=1785145 RepID=UPI001E486D10
LIEHEACGLAFEFSGKRTTLFGHQTPLSGEHSRLNGCPVSLDHYNTNSKTSYASRQFLIVSSSVVKIDTYFF